MIRTVLAPVAMMVTVVLSAVVCRANLPLQDEYSIDVGIQNLGPDTYRFTYSVTNNNQEISAPVPTGLDGLMIPIPSEAQVLNYDVPPSYRGAPGNWDWYIEGNWLTCWGNNPESTYPIGSTAVFTIDIANIRVSVGSCHVSTYWAHSIPTVPYTTTIYGNYTGYDFLAFVPVSETGLNISHLDFSLVQASAPAASNVGQIGALNGFSTTIDDALSEDEGMVYSFRSPGAASHPTFLDKGETDTYGVGERSLQSQAVYLRAPVKRVDTNGDYIIDENDTGWAPLALGHEIGQPALERQRDLTSTVEGSFQVYADIPDLQVRLTATGSIDSYTLASVLVDGAKVKHSFEAVRALILERSAQRALTKASAHFAAMATVELILDPVSEYAGEVTFDFAAGTASGTRTVIATDGFQQNLVGWTARTRKTEDLALGMMSVSAGDIVDWSADFRTMVETLGYAKVDAQLESYRIEAISGGEVIGVVHSWEDPIGGAAGAQAMAMAAADANGDGIPDQPVGDQDLLNNQLLEEEIVADLTYGQVALVESAGSVLPTSGVAMAQVDGNGDTAGFVTKLTMPVDAETMYLDYQLLSSADTGISADAVLALAVYDESGHVSVAEILPSDLTLPALSEASGAYIYGSGWLTAEFDLAGMDPEVYFAIAFDTESVTGIDLAVTLDNLRTFGAVIDPATLGDTNRDGVIDDADYDNLVAQFGDAPGIASADFNDDGRVDLEDFAIMRANFGYGVESSPAAAPGAATPEPSTMVIMFAGVAGLLLRRRRCATGRVNS